MDYALYPNRAALIGAVHRESRKGMDGGGDWCWNPESQFPYQCHLISSPTVQ